MILSVWVCSVLKRSYFHCFRVLVAWYECSRQHVCIGGFVLLSVSRLHVFGSVASDGNRPPRIDPFLIWSISRPFSLCACVCVCFVSPVPSFCATLAFVSPSFIFWLVSGLHVAAPVSWDASTPSYSVVG